MSNIDYARMETYFQLNMVASTIENNTAQRGGRHADPPLLLGHVHVHNLTHYHHDHHGAHILGAVNVYFGWSTSGNMDLVLDANSKVR